MPPVTPVDAAAATVTTTRRALGLRHLAVALAVLGLYSLALVLLLGR